MSQTISLLSVATNGDTSCQFAAFGPVAPGYVSMPVIVMLAVASAADFTDPASDAPTLTDSNNNVYNLVYSAINLHDATNNVFLAVAVYVCASAQQSSTAATVNLVGDLQPGSKTASMVYGLEMFTNFNQIAFDVAALSLGDVANFTVNAGAVGAGLSDLCLAFAIDGSLANTGDMTFISSFAPSEIISTVGPTDGASTILAYKQASGAPFLTGNLISNFGVGTASGVSGFVLGLRLSTQQGAAGKQLTFQISKGPEPKILPEGRAIATVIIDGTQQQFTPIVVPPGINYPEFSFFGENVSDSWETWWSTEFDLESVGPQGSRLTECRSLMARSRPFFGIDPNGARSDNPGWSGTSGNWCIGLLTNLTTLQTVVLGGNALLYQDSLDGQAAVGESLRVAFPCNAGGMKFRFIAVCSNTRPDGYGLGKWILNFTNFELPSDSIFLEHLGEGRYN